MPQITQGKISKVRLISAPAATRKDCFTITPAEGYSVTWGGNKCILFIDPASFSRGTGPVAGSAVLVEEATEITFDPKWADILCQAKVHNVKVEVEVNTSQTLPELLSVTLL